MLLCLCHLILIGSSKLLDSCRLDRPRRTAMEQLVDVMGRLDFGGAHTCQAARCSRVRVGGPDPRGHTGTWGRGARSRLLALPCLALTHAWGAWRVRAGEIPAHIKGADFWVHWEPSNKVR